jgi:O-6-methylguanine DNA methyltransferase
MSSYNPLYHYVSKIPQGKVTTYGQLAKSAGLTNPRHVGYLLHNNPSPKTIPCHRVVNSKGFLSNKYAFGGLKKQRELLTKEGVIVKKDKVDLKKYHWEH